MKKRDMNRKGFTLAEEVITVLLIGILVVSASGILMNAMRIFSMNVISLNAQAKGIAVMDELADNISYAKEISVITGTENFPEPTDATYQIFFYLHSDDGKQYLYSKTRAKNSAGGAWTTPVNNKLCVLSTFEAAYEISVNSGFADIDLQIKRGDKVWYSEKRKVELKNNPTVTNDFSYQSSSIATGQYLCIGCME